MQSFRAMNALFFTAGLPANFQMAAENWFALVERKLSRFRPDSELSTLNRSAGQPFSASPLLFQALSEAERFYRRTEGLFDPYLGSTLCELGYSRSFETLTEPTSPVVREASAIKGGSASCAELNPQRQSIRLSPAVSVDLGGFAKGWSAHQFSLKLREEGIRTGAIGAGGDISLWGTPDGGWRTGIADPWQEDRDLLKLCLRGTLGIATSSSVKRQWRDACGRGLHHIIDPRSGTSSDSDLAQVTVFAPNLVEAEVYAKCVLILGAGEGIKWLACKQPDSAVVGVRADHSVVVGGKTENYFMKGEPPYERIS